MPFSSEAHNRAADALFPTEVKSLATKIRNQYIGEGVVGLVTCLVQAASFCTSCMGGDGPSPIYISDTINETKVFEDELNEMRPLLFKYDMLNYYAYSAWKKLPNNGNWSYVNVNGWPNRWGSKVMPILYAADEGAVNWVVTGGPTLGLPWWIGGSHAVKASGKIRARRCGKKIDIQINENVKWEWHDVIDAHSYAVGFSTSGSSWESAALEGTVDLVGDKLLGADFKTIIKWTDYQSSKIHSVRLKDVAIEAYQILVETGFVN
ncbi:MAG: hypothetical protein JEZ07_13955 [Phycisphaerae bacterium]|nr:hypothetical protein [Phycisphaerae bacterium]